MHEPGEQTQQNETTHFLDKIEAHSIENFGKLKDRIFDYYYGDIREAFIERNQADTSTSREHIRQLFEPDPDDKDISDLRFIKAFLPFSIVKPEQIPPWTPLNIRQEILEDLDSEVKSKRYYANNVILGLVQLLQDGGLISSRDPRNPLQAPGIPQREKYEHVLSNIGGYEVYPTYAVVEKQPTDSDYLQTVSKYGGVYDQAELGIFLVLKMYSHLAERSTFTFCDSTYYLTDKERRDKELKAKTQAINTGLTELLMQGNVDSAKKAEVETQISIDIFPSGDYRVVVNYNSFIGDIIVTIEPTIETMAHSIFGASVLKPAIELSQKLKEWGILNTAEDYIEAQIIGPLTQNDCQGIFIQSWLIPYIDHVLNEMPEIKSRYDSLVAKGIITIHS